MTFLDLDQFFKSKEDWKKSFESSESVFKDPKWRVIRLGCTFIPEFYDGGEDEEKMYLALKFMLDVLEIRHFRIGIRWNKVWENGEINLKYYKKLIQFLIKKDVEITLCLGPIKSPGWPEQYVPNEILNKAKKLESVRQQENYIKEEAKKYFVKLIEVLKIELPKEVKRIKTFQIDNEPFNKFGDLHFNLDEDYLKNLIEILKVEFGQEVKVLINTPGRLDLKKFESLKCSCEKTNFTLGLNYYYAVDKFIRYPFYYLFNSNTVGKWGNLTFKNLEKIRQKTPFNLEVTEAQMEPWGVAKIPGNSIQSLQYVLLQTVRFLKYDQEWPLIIRLWGIEQLADKYIKDENNEEHDKMVEVIRFLNTKREADEKSLDLLNKISTLKFH